MGNIFEDAYNNVKDAVTNHNPFGEGGDIREFYERPLKHIVGFGTGGALNYDLGDPFGTKKALYTQQNMLNQYQAQQEQLMRNEQNRRWQDEISNSWAAYGVQRRSQAMGGGSALNTAASANDLYLGGR